MKRQQLLDLREQTAFEAAQFDYIASGIIIVALEEELPRCLIADRFGWTTDAVNRLLAQAGIGVEPDYFADRHNGRRAA